ncbi:MAG: hypothetical protein RL105_1012 [Verrucomicrobiota bacterium]|jgi:hypothetical protein
MSVATDDFAAVRPVRRINRAAQALLALALAASVNFLASLPSFRLREDLSADRRHSLAPESVETLRAAGRRSPVGEGRNSGWVRALVLAGDSSDESRLLRPRLLRLIDAYRLEAGRDGTNWFRVDAVGAGSSAALLSEIAARHGVPEADTALILTCNGRARYVRRRELTDGAGAFRGEEAVTSALIDVTEDRAAVCYVTRGHGELGLEDVSQARGLSQLSLLLRARNFEMRPLDLAAASEIPRDASMVLIAGPQATFSPAEAARLSGYLMERNGRVLALLEPGRDHGLDRLLAEWAIFSPDAELQEPDPAHRTVDGDVALTRLDPHIHPLTKVLLDQDLPLVASRLRPAKFDIGSTPDSTLAVWQLIFSSEAAWGEADPAQRPLRYDPARDQKGPVCVAAAAERATGIRQGAGGTGGRLVVVGTSDIAANARLSRGGNRAFMVQCAAWLTDRDRAVSLPARGVTAYQLTATTADLWALGLRFAFVPLAALAVGLAVSFWRRRT